MSAFLTGCLWLTGWAIRAGGQADRETVSQAKSALAWSTVQIKVEIILFYVTIKFTSCCMLLFLSLFAVFF